MEELDLERQKAEDAMREAQEKLSVAEEASRRAAEEAKKKAREIKTCVGLARPIGPKVPAFVTHRGQGAFNELDFVKKEKVKEILKEREEKKSLDKQEVDSDETERSETAAPDCNSNETTEETGEDNKRDFEASADGEVKKEEVYSNDTTEKTGENNERNSEASGDGEVKKQEVVEAKEPTKPCNGEIIENNETAMEQEVNGIESTE